MSLSELQLQQQDLLKLYKSSYRSDQSAKSYTYRLLRYCSDLPTLLTLPPKEAENKLISFLMDQKEKGMKPGSLNNYAAAVLHFYLINDIELNKTRIKRFLPSHIKAHKDRAYYPEEIQAILELCNERSRVIVLLLSSSGMRIGALPGMKVSDLEDKGEFYKITVYPNTESEYFTYCTPEAKQALRTYFNIRERHGEAITPKSPVIREQYHKYRHINIAKPKHVSKDTMSVMINEIVERTGLRTRIPKTSEEPNLKDVKLMHGFRKFFNTQLIRAKANPLIKEILMGHNVGLEANYYRPTEEDIQLEYCKAIDALTINPENRLKKKLSEEMKKRDEITIMKLKHEREMKEMRKKIHRSDRRNEDRLKKIFLMLQENPKLAKVKPKILADTKINN